MNAENYLTLARMAAKRRNHSEAYKYWSLVVEGGPRNVEAWIGKATAQGWKSNFFGEGIKEAASNLEQAVELGLTDETQRKQAAASAYLLPEEFFDRASSEYLRLSARPDPLQPRVFLELTCELTGRELLRLAWQLKKSAERASTLIKICNAYRKRFGREGGDFVDRVLHDCQEWVSKNDPTAAQALPRAAVKPACFIATASYRTCDHPRVKLLQEFRDSLLLIRRSGRLFVSAYHRFSPSVARLIENNRLLQKMSRILLISPVFMISKWLLRRTKRDGKRE